MSPNSLFPLNCTFSISKTGAESIEVGPEAGSCIDAFFDARIENDRSDLEEQRKFNRGDLKFRGEMDGSLFLM